MPKSANLLDHLHFVEALPPQVPASATPATISLKNAEAVGILIHAKNGTTVTGSAITLTQSTTVAGAGSKALAMPFYFSNINAATVGNDAPWTKVFATNNTFTADGTNSQDSYYFIPVDPASLDTANGYRCLSLGVANATAQTISAHFVSRPKYNGNATLLKPFTVD